MATTAEPAPTTDRPSRHDLLPQRLAAGGVAVLLWVIAIVALAALHARAQPAHGAGLLVADGGFGGVLEIREHDVDVTINNGVAVTTVEQTFLNTENRVVEALYTFPVPKGASVANFSMWINGQEMIGEVVEKERAREIYESYKQTRRDPGLLEQVDYKTFEMRIFPIAAGAEQRVRVTYYQELDADHDWATYVYPLATVTRSGIDQRTTGRFALRMRVLSETPIVGMESPSHGDAFIFATHTDHFREASLETQAGDLSRDVVLAYRTSRPNTSVDLITSKPKGEDGYLQLTLTAGEELAAFDRAKDYVFVVDVSGSMANDGKLQTSTRSVAAFVDALGPDDRFELVAFNIQPATEEAKARAAEFLDSQRARGGTTLAPAMQLAYRYADPSGDRPLIVVILSDGMTEQGERRELLRLMNERPRQARVFAVGVGNEVNRPLLEQMAQDAGGLAAFVSPGDDFERQAKAFRRKLTRPVATDLKITFDGGGVYDLEPLTLPNLYHGSPIRLYGRYRDAGPVKVTIAANVLGRPITQTARLELPEADGGNPEIERMWAWHRVDRLLKEADRTGSRDAVIDEIVRLGEGYSIATEYTSFIVLENDAEYQRWKIDRTNATRIARDRASRETLTRKLDRLRQNALANLGPAPAPSAGGDAAVKMSEPVGPQAAAPQQPQQNPQPSRGWDIDLGSGAGGNGGGAIDPLTGALLLFGAGGLFAVARRRA